MLSCKKQCFRGFDIAVLSVPAPACEYPVRKRNAFIDCPALETHLRRRKEPVYDKHIGICNELCLQSPECTVLHLSSKQSLMPSFDIFILDDDKLSSFRDVMVCLIGLCTPFIGKLLIFSSDEMSCVIPAPESLLLASSAAP